MRDHNICFWRNKKISLNYPQYPLLSGALINASFVSLRLILKSAIAKMSDENTHDQYLLS